VLASVAVVSHGMLELFKRIFVLVAASILLQVGLQHPDYMPGPNIGFCTMPPLGRPCA
jgi:hypothetical protein